MKSAAAALRTAFRQLLERPCSDMVLNVRFVFKPCRHHDMLPVIARVIHAVYDVCPRRLSGEPIDDAAKHSLDHVNVLLSIKNRKATAGLFHESFFGIIPFGERLDCRRNGGDDDNHLPEDFP